jgi:hypothetical protein
MSKKRKYDESYVSYGFTFTVDREGKQKPQCFLCGKVLANGSMKPTKLKDHLISVHPGYSSASADVFRANKARFEKGGTLPMLGFVPTQKPCFEASYKVAYRIAKQKKPHTIGETLVKPCALEIVELVCGLEQKKKIEAVPLSNDTIRSRIADMSSNILKQVMDELRSSPFPFGIQLDETTDVSQCSQLLVFVRYVHVDEIKEEFLFCEPLLETAKATDILEIVNGFFSKQNFDWKKHVGSVCTDGAPAMLGNTSGFAALVKREAPQISVTHCFLHRHALATKTLPSFLKDILLFSIKVINSIRARALQHRLFKRLCQELGAEHEVLLYHTEVRWLSRGQILKRLLELRTEVELFLREHKSPLSEHFSDNEFIKGLAYLGDIFGHMNEINLSLQGSEVTILDASERLQAFLQKLPLWRRRVEAGNFANFPMLEEMLLQDDRAKDRGLSNSMREAVCKHLSTLQTSFEGYFSPSEQKIETWIRNPFVIDINCVSDDDFAKDDLIDLRTKQMLRNEFNMNSVGNFWCSVSEAYPRLAKRAVNTIIPFATTYLCESGFSALVSIKTKSRNRLNVRDDMRVCLSKTTPQFALLVQNKQEQHSH